MGLHIWYYTKPSITDTEKLNKWEESRRTSSIDYPNDIAPNVQAGLDCTSTKKPGTVWWAVFPADPIAQNLTHAHLHAKHFIEGNAETLPGLSRTSKTKRILCSLGVTITTHSLPGIIMLSMLTPSWDPVIGTLGGVLDLRVVISCLNTEWTSDRSTSSDKDWT